MTQSYLLFITALSVASSFTARAELLFSSLNSPPQWTHSVNNPNLITALIVGVRATLRF